MRKNFYGIVEGFFSDPLPRWTPTERLATLRFLIRSRPRINTYLYCPKNDPYITAHWDVPYPARELRDIAKAARLCAKNNILFVYGFNPAFSLDTIQKDFNGYREKITYKINQLASIGIRTFCILYDDIPYAYTVLAGAKDKRSALIGETQARVMNALAASLNKRHI